MTDEKKPEMPPIGGFCDECGHIAGRHTATGCPGIKNPCDCRGLLWLGHRWAVPERGEPTLIQEAQQ